MGVEIADGEVLHPAEHLLAELVEKALRHVGHELLLHQDRENGEDIQHDEQRQDGLELGLRRGPVARNIPLFDDLNDVLCEKRGDGGHDGRKQDARERDGGEHRVVGEQLFHRALQHSKVCGAGIGPAAGVDGLTLHPAHLRSSGIHRPRGRSRSRQGAARACPCPRCGRCPSPG